MAIENDLQILSYMQCGRCLDELPDGESPQSYARKDVGFTRRGIQIWCVRHSCNIAHIDFEGVKHPANTTARGDA